MNHGSWLCKIRGSRVMSIRAQTFHKGKSSTCEHPGSFSKQFFKHEKNCRLPKCTSATSRLCKIDKTTSVHTKPSPIRFPPRSIPPHSQSFCADVRRAPGSPTSLNPTSPRATLAVPCTSTCCSAQINLSALSRPPAACPVLASDITILTSQLSISESPSVPFSFFTHSKCCQSSERVSCVYTLTHFLSPCGYPRP